LTRRQSAGRRRRAHSPEAPAGQTCAHCGYKTETVVLDVEPIRHGTPDVGGELRLRLCLDCATAPGKTWRLRWRPLVDG
jgi:hypothetical protein